MDPSVIPTPSITATVAPRDAPEEMPRMYGSASGFFTMACMTTPLMDSPTPTAAASTSRGRRISHTTSWIGVPGAHSSGMGSRRKIRPNSQRIT